MAAQQPTYHAYTVIKREGQDDFWLAIGAAFMHQDGDGYNVSFRYTCAHETLTALCRVYFYFIRTLTCGLLD